MGTLCPIPKPKSVQQTSMEEKNVWCHQHATWTFTLKNVYVLLINLDLRENNNHIIEKVNYFEKGPVIILRGLGKAQFSLLTVPLYNVSFLLIHLE